MNSLDDLGRLATRAAVDLAIVCYFAAAILELLDRDQSGHRRTARLVWTLGWLFYICHVSGAFQFYHHWSHHQAYAEAARRTAELFGWASGFGLYVNYAFTLAWTGDIAWRWLSPTSHQHRPRWLAYAWHGFFLFMVINGAIIFGAGPSRWLGLAGCTALLFTCLATSRKRFGRPGL